MLPKIIFQPQFELEKIIFNLPEEDVEIHFEKNEFEYVKHLLSEIDGTKSVEKLIDEFSSVISFNIKNCIDELYRHRIIDDCLFPEGRSGIDVLFELEDLANVI